MRLLPLLFVLGLTLQIEAKEESIAIAKAQSLGAHPSYVSEPPKERTLRGLVLLGEEEELLSRKDLADIDGCWSIGIPQTEGRLYLRDELNQQYVGKPWTPKTLEAIKDTIARYYVAHGNPFVLVTVPEQNVTQNIVQIVIVQAKLGKLEYTGNTWTPTSVMQQYMAMPEGSPISIEAVEKNLNFFNRNPFRRAPAIYEPGGGKGETNMTVVVKERAHSFRWLTGFENNGVYEIERERWFTGFSVAYFLWIESLFSLQYTAAYQPDLFQAYTGQWQFFFPWKHELNLNGGYSTVHDARVTTPGTKNGGHTSQITCRYLMPLPWNTRVQSDFYVGVDWKNMNSFIEFGDFFENFDDGVTIFDLVAGTSLFMTRNATECRAKLEVLASPGEWLSSQQSSARYNLARPGATNYWVRARGEAELLYFLRYCTLRFFFEGQYSNFVLLPSEQMGLGGYGTVRGYTERQLNADSGLVGSVEFRSPHFPVFTMLRGMKVRDGLQFLAFSDYGLSMLNKNFGPEPKFQYLWGVGLGARYTLNEYLTARFDWGYKLHLSDAPAPAFFGPRNLLHFSVSLSLP